MKKISILSLLIIVTGIGVFAITQVQERIEKAEQERIAGAHLTKTSSVQVEDALLALVHEQSPQYALNELFRLMQQEPAVANDCHPFVHAIGHEAYNLYNDFGTAMEFQSELCNSGYIHGVIEEHFESSHNPLTEMQTLCDVYTPNSYLQWQCFHGVGHGVMFYSQNDLPFSVTACRDLSTPFAQDSCVNGVFMENFNLDQKNHISPFVNPADPFYPCAEQQEQDRATCYVYAPTYWFFLHKDLPQDDRYIQGIEWCHTLDQPWQDVCMTGVGSHMMKENIQSPSIVEEYCEEADESGEKQCISGMATLYLFHSGNREQAEQFCSQLKKIHQPSCQAALDQHRFLFE